MHRHKLAGLPFFDAFNSPDNVSSCAGRDSTVVASQALTLLNSPDTLTHARTFAGRLWRESKGDANAAATLAWRLVFERAITSGESERAVAFLQSRETEWNQTTPATGMLPVGISETQPMPPGRGAAWVEWCLALLNANEFVYVD